MQKHDQKPEPKQENHFFRSAPEMKGTSSEVRQKVFMSMLSGGRDQGISLMGWKKPTAEQSA